MICRKSDSDSNEKVIQTLKSGGIVILPTDTVYGFSGIVNSDFDTDKKIRQIKGRAEIKPFIELISAPNEIKNYTDDVLPDKLIDFWPGPLTIIVNDKRFSGKTTAFRCPGDEWLRKIIGECGFPVYSTSVNRSGNPVLSKESEIITEFENEVDLIVLDGDTAESVPSTIVSVAEFDGTIKIIRQGKIDLSGLDS